MTRSWPDTRRLKVGNERGAAGIWLDFFTLPPGSRGKPAWVVQLWWLAQGSLFGWSPQIFYGWRRFLLRLFGARVGRSVLVRPTVRITYPWKLRVGDFSWIGDHVVLYTLGDIDIGMQAVVSQKCYLCTGSHDYRKPAFDIYAEPITIGDGAWLATDVYVAPGVNIGPGAVIGARSSVFEDVPEFAVAVGTPARVVRKREHVQS